MRHVRFITLVALASTLTGCSWWCGITGSCRENLGAIVSEERLPIFPVQQDTPVWCWLATGEMIHRYYNNPNVNPFGYYQCGMVGILYPAQCAANCLNCISGANSFAVVNDMIIRYPLEVMSLAGLPATPLQTIMEDRRLSFEEVRTEIDASRPVLVAVNPSGFRISNQLSEHVALIVGYRVHDSGAHVVIVNDPWPYELNVFNGRTDPYKERKAVELLNNQYAIKYEDFSSRLSWAQTIHGIRPITVSFAMNTPYIARAGRFRD